MKELSPIIVDKPVYTGILERRIELSSDRIAEKQAIIAVLQGEIDMLRVGIENARAEIDLTLKG